MVACSKFFDIRTESILNPLVALRYSRDNSFAVTTRGNSNNVLIKFVLGKDLRSPTLSHRGIGSRRSSLIRSSTRTRCGSAVRMLRLGRIVAEDPTANTGKGNLYRHRTLFISLRQP
jgi:hypothetical protein